MTVTGSSMMPLLRPNRDVVWLEKCDAERIEKGDVLLFEREGGKPVLHRVVKIKNNRLIMNGDALDWSEVIEKSQVIACVKKIDRDGKTIDCGSKPLKLWETVWNSTAPVRPAFKKIYNLVKRRRNSD